MNLTAINFAVASHAGNNVSVNGSQLVNMYAEIQPQDSKVPVVVYSCPGSYKFTSLPDGPVQGMAVMDDLLYAITPRSFFRIDRDGSYTNLGSVIFNSRGCLSTNGIHIVAVDGNRGYAYSVAGGLIEMAGEGWYPANTVTHQDGFFIFPRKSTGQFFITNLLSIDLDALDYATAEAAPDDTLAILSDQRVLWLFGADSTEIWYNVGNVDFPFQRMQGAYIEKGIAAAHTAVKLDNSIFWLGNDHVVYRTQGYGFGRVSTHAVESEFLSGNVSTAYAYSYEECGHAFYVLTIPSLNRTCVYDVATQLWHERSHSVLGRHNSLCYADCYGKHFVGDFQNGNIYVLDDNVHHDNNDVLVREAVAPVLHNGRNRVSMYGLELQLNNPGNPSVSDFTGEHFIDPKVSMSFSDDNMRSWCQERYRVFGKYGQVLQRVSWGPMGQFVQRHIKLRVTDPVDFQIACFFAKLEYND